MKKISLVVYSCILIAGSKTFAANHCAKQYRNNAGYQQRRSEQFIPGDVWLRPTANSDQKQTFVFAGAPVLKPAVARNQNRLQPRTGHPREFSGSQAPDDATQSASKKPQELVWNKFYRTREYKAERRLHEQGRSNERRNKLMCNQSFINK